jgi:hypothetical protein
VRCAEQHKSPTAIITGKEIGQAKLLEINGKKLLQPIEQPFQADRIDPVWLWTDV